MRIDGVEIDRACQNDHIGIDHLLQNAGHVILVDTYTAVVTAVVAGRTRCNLLFGNADFLYFIARFQCAAQKLITQNIGVAALAGDCPTKSKLFYP